MKQIILGFALGALILVLLLALPSVRAERTNIPFLSPPVPPLCGPGIAGECVEWREDLRDWRQSDSVSPLPAPARHCGKRYGENWCD